jgi:lipid-binding SYLF domain-containing protein
MSGARPSWQTIPEWGLQMRRLTQTALVLTAIAGAVFCVPTVAKADDAAERAEIDGQITAALTELYTSVPGSRDVAKEAEGMLVFPAIYKAGIGIGAEHGKGALQVKGKSIAYYTTSGASLGVTLGLEKYAMAVMFMNKDPMEKFQASSGWDFGADAGVTVATVGADGSVNTSDLEKKAVVVFQFGNSGLMGDLSLGGTKVSKMDLAPAAASGSSTPQQ